MRRLEKDEHEKDDAPHLESSYRRINILVIRRKMHGANMLLPLPEKKKKRHEKIEIYPGFNSIDIGEGVAFTVTDIQVY